MAATNKRPRPLQMPPARQRNTFWELHPKVAFVLWQQGLPTLPKHDI